jgi:hypothetical protein
MESAVFDRNAHRPIVQFVVSNTLIVPTVANCTPHHIRVMTCAMAPPESEMKSKKQGFWYVFATAMELAAYCANVRALPQTTEVALIPLEETVLFGIPDSNQICIGLGVKTKNNHVTPCAGGIFSSK